MNSPPRSEDEPLSGEEISTKIVSRIAAETGRSPLDLSPPLGEVIDVDALDRLLADADADVRVTVRYLGTEIVVDGDGDCTISDTPLQT